MENEYGANVISLVEHIHSLKHLFTKIRDVNTNREAFVRFANRLMTNISEEGLSFLGNQSVTVTTPTGSEYHGENVDANNVVAVSIIRAGDSLLDCFIRVAPEATVGKILIQRDENTKEPVLFYSKLPNLVGKKIVLLDPMLATGGSAKVAVDVLIENGAEEKNIVFLNVVACPEGIKRLTGAFPALKLVTGQIDTGLNEKAYIVPGLGDYGDRFYGTDGH